MSNYLNLNIGSRYTFETYGNAILERNINNVKVVGIMDGMTAQRLGYDVATYHQQIFPHLPQAGVTKNFLDQNYIEVEYDNGNRQAFGEYWINASTIRIETQTTLIVTLIEVNAEQQSALPEVLAANGYNVAKIERKEV